MMARPLDGTALLLSYWLPSTMMLFWKYGISRPPFLWNTWTSVAAFNDQCILPITSSLAERNVVGLSANPQTSYSASKRRAPTALFGMNRESGAVHQGKRLRRRMA